MTPSNSVRYHPPTKPTFRQTILWFLAGTAGMFLIVSAIFAIKLGSEGRLPFFNTHNTAQTASRPARTADNATATPPIASQSAAESAAAPAASSSAKEFISGAEGILPPEAAHLAKVGIATEQPPLGAAPPAPPPPDPPLPAHPGAATVFSPFKAATAILTVEQGGLLEHRSVRVQGSSAMLSVPITAAHAPHAHAAVTLLRQDPERS